MKRPSVPFLLQRKEAIRRDLDLKCQAEDWHGVADAAMDLREIEAQLHVLDPLAVTPSADAPRTTLVMEEWGAREVPV